MTKQDPKEISGVSLCADQTDTQFVLANNSTSVWEMQVAPVGTFTYVTQSFVSLGIQKVVEDFDLQFVALSPGDVVFLPPGEVTWTLQRELSFLWAGSAEAFGDMASAIEARLVRSTLNNLPKTAAAIYTCTNEVYRSIGTGETVLSGAEVQARVRAGLNTVTQAGVCATSVKAALQEQGAVKIPTFVEITERIGQRAGQVTAFESRVNVAGRYMTYVCQVWPRGC